MTKVKRYDPVTYGWDGFKSRGGMEIDSDGDFVSAEDYDALLAAAKALAAEVEAADVRDLGVSVALDAWYALTDEAGPIND